MKRNLGVRQTCMALGLLVVGGLPGCGDSDGDAAGDGGAQADAMAGTAQGLIRGRVTGVDGAPLGDLEVKAAGATTRTSADGHFELEVKDASPEVRVTVESLEYSGAELPVRLEKDAAANVEIAVKPRRKLMLADAAEGGRVTGDADGFALELPKQALQTRDGKAVSGEVEVRYALINRSGDVTAAPGRMEDNGGGLDGYGMAEVRFYQDGERLRLAEEMTLEVPMHAGHELSEGDRVDLYELGDSDLRWRRGTRGMVRGDKVVIETRRDEWVGAARQLPVDSCVRGRLGTELETSVRHTTIRAARERGLSMVQAETANDGSFCLPVTPNDDWQVSTFYDDGRGAYGLDVPVNSADATGMCGGDTGCKDVGDVQLGML